LEFEMSSITVKAQTDSLERSSPKSLARADVIKLLGA
jgi:hypothetical protein